MKVQLQNVSQTKIVVFDIEYNQNSLAQFASLILHKTEPNIFSLKESINIYIKQSHLLNSFFTNYTNITNAFLRDNGQDLSVARTLVEKIILNTPKENTLLVSHGIKNDLELLYNNGIQLNRIPNNYCTYEKAKTLLNRETHLTLKDVAAESGYYMFNEHNAYADV